jgi:hypothetical protein
VLGREHDTRPITTTGELTDIRVAAYVAKYATKAAECTGTLDRRITATDSLAELPVSEHARRLIGACLRLSKLAGLEDLRLAAWAHMLGFRGHFSTKSRHYSTTFGALRAERAQHQRDHAPTESLWPEPEDDTTLVVTDWRSSSGSRSASVVWCRCRVQRCAPTHRPHVRTAQFVRPEAATGMALCERLIITLWLLARELRVRAQVRRLMLMAATPQPTVPRLTRVRELAGLPPSCGRCVRASRAG